MKIRESCYQKSNFDRFQYVWDASHTFGKNLADLTVGWIGNHASLTEKVAEID